MTDTLRHEVFLESPIGTFDVRKMRLTETVHEPSSATIEVRDAEDPGFSGLVDQDVVVLIHRSGVPVRRFALRVARTSYLGLRDGVHAWELELHDAFWFLHFVKDVRKFRDVSAKEIIEKVLGQAGVAHRFELAREPWSRPYTVQYRETSFDFVMRLLEFEGIHRRAEDDGTLVLTDRSSASPSAGDGVELVFSGAALSHGLEALTTFGRGARVGSGRATVNDYNWKKPKQSLLQSQSGKRDLDLEVYDFPVGYRDGGQGETLARLRLEACEAEKRFATGSGNVSAFRAGTHFSFEHADGIAHGGSWFLTEVTHHYEWVGEDLAPKFENRFRATPLDVPYRPPLTTPVPEIHGLHTAMARGPEGEEIHTDQYGRFKAQFHWDREATSTDKDSRWLRMVQETSSSIVLQRVGWEAAVGYVSGDPDRPIGVARKINGQMVPTYGQPANQNVMTIKTETYPHKDGANEIRIDDTAGSQSIRITAQDQYISQVENDQHETIHHDERHTIGHLWTRTTGGNQALAIGHDETIDIGSTDSFRVNGNRTVTIGGNETVKVKESATVDVKASDSETVGSVRTSIVGGIKKPELPSISSLTGGAKLPSASSLQGSVSAGPGGASVTLPNPSSVLPNPQSLLAGAKGSLEGAIPKSPEDLLQGQITRSTTLVHDLMIGGVHVAIAGGSVTNRAGKLLAELTGGLKLSISSEDSLLQTIKGDCTRVVGVSAMENAAKEIARSSNTTVVNVGATATITGPKGFDAHGETVLIEGLTKIALVAGDLTIELHPDSIQLRGKGKLIAGTDIKVSGTPDNVTE